MYDVLFIQDLAIMMLIAAVMSFLCEWLKQPVVMGYMVAGMMIGPYTPPFAFVQDQQSIEIFASLGMLFLMFTLGLEFNVKKIKELSGAALLATIIEVTFMIAVGYGVGKLLKWDHMNSLFLGAMLAISSTSIIIKMVKELKLKHEKFIQLVYGILVVEDILAIIIIAFLSSIAPDHSIDYIKTGLSLLKLMAILSVIMLFGLILLPPFMDKIIALNNKEILLLTVLGLCFGFSLLIMISGYPAILGAFIIGAILAESRHSIFIERMIETLRDMFSAIFFIAVGLMFDPKILIGLSLPILLITLTVILSKTVSCSIGAYFTGLKCKDSLKVGATLSQIGEFSFVMAALGAEMEIIDEDLYPIAVVVSILTTIFSAYLIRYIPK